MGRRRRRRREQLTTRSLGSGDRRSCASAIPLTRSAWAVPSAAGAGCARSVPASRWLSLALQGGRGREVAVAGREFVGAPGQAAACGDRRLWGITALPVCFAVPGMVFCPGRVSAWVSPVVQSHLRQGSGSVRRALSFAALLGCGVWSGASRPWVAEEICAPHLARWEEQTTGPVTSMCWEILCPCMHNKGF